MAIDATFFERSNKAARPALLVSAVLHLMSHYVAAKQQGESCPKLASVIERHLKALADLPELEPVLRATCSQLSEQWRQVVEHAIRPVVRPNLFVRLVTPTRA